MSFDEARDKIRSEIIAAKKSGNNNILSIPVTFKNDDVPNYLKRLDNFERGSKLSRRVVK